MIRGYLLTPQENYFSLFFLLKFAKYRRMLYSSWNAKVTYWGDDPVTITLLARVLKVHTRAGTRNYFARSNTQCSMISMGLYNPVQRPLKIQKLLKPMRHINWDHWDFKDHSVKLHADQWELKDFCWSRIHSWIHWHTIIILKHTFSNQWSVEITNCVLKPSKQ